MPIVLTNASFSYPDGSLAVDSVSLRINDGERVAIVGQNGAGKTTTVKMMNGLLKPSSGSVEVDGIDTTARTTAETARMVGYVFQNPDDQIFGSDVQSELEYMPKYLNWDPEKAAQRVKRAAKMAGIGRFLKINPNDLPFAIKKFVAISSILVGECKYVVLDEPTAGLDGRGLKLLNRMIDQLQDEGVSVITITHDMRFVVDSFTRVVAMANRKIIADGPCEEVFGDDEILKAAKLKRPEVSQLARELGLSGSALHLDEIVALIP